ncbi:MAG: hypothetical protein V4749_08950 [Pseudomonadota bacterium]
MSSPSHELLIDTPLAELIRLAECHPAYTLLEVIALLDRDRWDIEAPTQSEYALYNKINARKALEHLRRSVDGFQSAHALDSPENSHQWLATGSHLRVNALVDQEMRDRLVSHCDALLDVPGTPPLRLLEHPQCVDQDMLRAIATTVLASLPDSLPIGSRPAILKRRTILRRTFPPCRLPAQLGNANNQFWHQDTNAQFNDAPMLTLWIPLQEGSGTIRPGLQIIDAPVAYFSIVHGDSSRAIAPLLSQMFPASRVESLQVAAGECIVFNGLTFHQTWTTEHMMQHRDALLIRIIEERSAHLFAVVDPHQELLSLV